MSYRKLEVDSLNLDDENEEEVSSPVSAPNLEETTALIDSRIAEVSDSILLNTLIYFQAAAEGSTMKNGLVVLSNTCSNYQQALEKRYYALTLYDEACRNTEKQKRVMERLRLSNQSLTSDKVTSSVEELESKHAIESKYRIHFKLASEFILRDQVNIEKNWVEDMDNLMNEWSRVYFEFEKKRASEVWIKDSIVV
ncbi:hypothetical protein HMI54_004679 [Coelomomyces lativittatus]|nr:hypothetical protein HMI54_004679 [Coelomomyces lativittatus]